MKGLEKYLNSLVRTINLLECPEAWEFLQMEPSVRVLLSSLDYEVKSDPYRLFENPDYFARRTRTKSAKVSASGLVNEFLECLCRNPLVVTKTVQRFEEIYFEMRPECNKDEIEKLLWGDDKLKGILAHCGTPDNFIGGIYSLNFFAKLLKYEYNSLAADNFLAIYRCTKPSLIKEMNLGKHIKMNMSSDNSGLLSLYYYLSGNIFGVYAADELMEDKEAIEIYESWVCNKIKWGYLSNALPKKAVTRDARADSKSTVAEDDKESGADTPRASCRELSITPDLIELSKALSSGRLEYLMGELDCYSEWMPLDTEVTKMGVVKSYTQGKNNFRLCFQLFSDNIENIAEQFIDPRKHTLWSSIQRCVIFEADMLEIVQSVYRHEGYTESIVERELEHFCDIAGDCIIVKEFSLLLPASSLSEVKRLHINAAVSKLSCKSDRYGANYVEFQAIWSVDEGYDKLPEYILYKSQELRRDIENLIKS